MNYQQIVAPKKERDRKKLKKKYKMRLKRN